MRKNGQGRLLVCSDIHGYTEGLLQLLDFVKYDCKQDQLFLLGDYIDHEPATFSSLVTIKQLVDEGAFALAGNFELRLKSKDWMRKAKDAGVGDELLEFVSQLPAYYEVDHYLFVHAGLRPEIELDHQSLKDLTEIRAPFLFGEDVSWRKKYRGIVFGHTPTFKLGAKLGNIWSDGFRLGIDTGAKHGGRLTLIELKERLIYSCKPVNLVQYEQFKMEYF